MVPEINLCGNSAGGAGWLLVIMTNSLWEQENINYFKMKS